MSFVDRFTSPWSHTEDQFASREFRNVADASSQLSAPAPTLDRRPDLAPSTARSLPFRCAANRAMQHRPRVHGSPSRTPDVSLQRGCMVGRTGAAHRGSKPSSCQRPPPREPAIDTVPGDGEARLSVPRVPAVIEFEAATVPMQPTQRPGATSSSRLISIGRMRTPFPRSRQ